MTVPKKERIWGIAQKKPVAVQFREVEGEYEQIQTREGTLKGYKGKDFIIKGIEGEVYPIDKKIFYKTYNILITTDGTVLKGYHDVEEFYKDCVFLK